GRLACRRRRPRPGRPHRLGRAHRAAHRLVLRPGATAPRRTGRPTGPGRVERPRREMTDHAQVGAWVDAYERLWRTPGTDGLALGSTGPGADGTRDVLGGRTRRPGRGLHVAFVRGRRRRDDGRGARRGRLRLG